MSPVCPSDHVEAALCLRNQSLHSNHSFSPLVTIVHFPESSYMHPIIQPSQQTHREVSCCPQITAERAESQRGSRFGLEPGPV